jgi:membrane carboxypeptidase/penicillin-binding protein
VRKRRNAAWFAGYAPANHPPLYAFSVVVEGNPGETVSGGTTAAPVIGKVLSNLLKDYKPPEKKKEEEPKEETPTDEATEPSEAAPVPVDETTEFTEDLMNPEGAPVPEELSGANGSPVNGSSVETAPTE